MIIDIPPYSPTRFVVSGSMVVGSVMVDTDYRDFLTIEIVLQRKVKIHLHSNASLLAMLALFLLIFWSLEAVLFASSLIHRTSEGLPGQDCLGRWARVAPSETAVALLPNAALPAATIPSRTYKYMSRVMMSSHVEE